MTPFTFFVNFSLGIHYCITLHRMRNVEIKLIRYAADNICADGPLQMALRGFASEFNKGYIIAICCLILTLINFIFFVYPQVDYYSEEQRWKRVCRRKKKAQIAVAVRNIVGDPKSPNIKKISLQTMQKTIREGILCRLRAYGA